MYRPNSLWTWSFLLVALVQALVALGLEGFIFGKFQTSLHPLASIQNLTGETKTIPTYLALLIFGFVYEVVLVIDALAAKNTIQVIGICIMNLAILVYTAIQIDQIHQAFDHLHDASLIHADYWTVVEPYLIALPCVTALGTVILSFIAWKLYEEFAWTIYKQISADLRLKKRYLIYQIYIALLKFDLFLFLGFVIQFLVIVQKTNESETYLTIAALPVIIAVLIAAWWSVKRESFMGMVLTIIVYFVALAYFIFKLVRMYSADKERQAEYAPARTTLTVFAVITIVFLLITITTACWCTRNFNKGLKPHVSKSAKAKEDAQLGMGDKMYMNDVRPHYGDDAAPHHHHHHHHGHGGMHAGGSRMEID